MANEGFSFKDQPKMRLSKLDANNGVLPVFIICCKRPHSAHWDFIKISKVTTSSCVLRTDEFVRYYDGRSNTSLVGWSKRWTGPVIALLHIW